MGKSATQFKKKGLVESFILKPAVCFFLLAAAGFISLMWITGKWGIGLVADSIGYINAAETFFRGGSFSDLPRSDGTIPYFTRHGPLLPLIIAGVCFLTQGDGSRAAQWVQSFFYAANIGLAQFLTYQYTRSVRTALFSGFLVLMSLVMLEVHATALSEPVFLFFGLSGFYCLSVYFKNNDKKRMLFSSVVLLAASVLSRYAGIAVGATVGILFFVFSKGNFLKRLIFGGIMSLLICVPMLIWVARNYSSSRYVGVPSVMYDPYFSTSFWELGAFTSAWLFPVSSPAKLRMTALAIFSGLASLEIFFIFCLERKSRQSERQRALELSFFPWILLVFSVIHIAVHILSASLVDRNILDDRHLAPVNISLILILSMWTWRLWEESRPWGRLRFLILAVILFFGVSYPMRYADWARRVRLSGIGYASPQWMNSELIRKINQLPEGVPIYSNGMDIVYWMTRRPVRPIPDKLDWHDKPDSAPVKLNPQILEQMLTDVTQKKAILAYFNTIYWRDYYPKVEQLQEHIPLERFESVSDGDLYRLAQQDSHRA